MIYGTLLCGSGFGPKELWAIENHEGVFSLQRDFAEVLRSDMTNYVRLLTDKKGNHVSLTSKNKGKNHGALLNRKQAERFLSGYRTTDQYLKKVFDHFYQVSQKLKGKKVRFRSSMTSFWLIGEDFFQLKKEMQESGKRIFYVDFYGVFHIDPSLSSKICRRKKEGQCIFLHPFYVGEEERLVCFKFTKDLSNILLEKFQNEELGSQTLINCGFDEPIGVEVW